MKAMILAAGRGERMRPLTDHTPKPLLSVAGKPLIVYHIERLAQAGFTDIVINLAHLGKQIPIALGSGEQWNINIHYSDEGKQALETAGGIKKALPLLGEHPFCVVNGDIWCDYSFKPLKLKDNDTAHLILVHNPDHNPTGDFALNNGRATQHGKNKYTFSGIGYYRPELFIDLDEGKHALAPLLRQAMDNNRVSAELHTGLWRDIGTPERLQEINNETTS